MCEILSKSALKSALSTVKVRALLNRQAVLGSFGNRIFQSLLMFFVVMCNASQGQLFRYIGKRRRG
ncbi:MULTISPECIES: hypothetical protein [unclassified Herbaspirillum]|uniref:hypothetical protein n=1 Tax=unclassified Herbaspirillum TaxID=2624150 RepID=UPI00115056A6|nr:MULTISPECIES: hypothetical protein [unclassified Herbaspirillum]MBB5390488.1 hypothetical protein [Herbaspirillum sp. SJZ102]